MASTSWAVTKGTNHDLMSTIKRGGVHASIETVISRFFLVPSEVMIISYVRCWGGRVSLCV